MKKYLMQFDGKRQERNTIDAHTKKDKRAEMKKIYKQLKENN